ncbi:MAG TPA: ABC transporter permease [Candidatus Atribacteria bacterium]|jgi:simple sugar transport system permease protein|nr:ABC transporter permease [Candidatus Atribacteria bacterium]
MKYRNVREISMSLIPIAAFLLALLIGTIMIAFLGVNPLVAYQALLKGAFGSTNAIADTIVKATPLLFVGLGICIAFRAGVLNIGGEGQLVVGALSATIVCLNFPNLPGWILIIIALLVGLLSGAIWAGIAGFLKAYFNVNEILSTIMLNYIAAYGMNYLLRGPIMDPLQIELGSFIPQTTRLTHVVDLPRLIPTRLHFGTIIAVVFAILVYIFLWRTTIGFRIRMIGQNIQASRASGINVQKYMVLAFFLSGALIGLGGATEVLGVHHRLFTDGSVSGFTGSAGFNGIVAALFGQLHPIGTIPASLLLGALLTGANKMQRVVQIPSALIGALNGLIVLFVVGSEYLRRSQARRMERTADAKNNSKNKNKKENE